MLVDKTKNVYFQGKVANKIYLGNKLIYEKGTGNLATGYAGGNRAIMSWVPDPPDLKSTTFTTTYAFIAGSFTELYGNLKPDTIYTLFFTFNIQQGTEGLEDITLTLNKFTQANVSNYFTKDGIASTDFPRGTETLTPYKDVAVRLVFKTPTANEVANMTATEKTPGILIGGRSSSKIILIKDVFIGEGILPSIPK